jgi:hypothetical protein
MQRWGHRSWGKREEGGERRAEVEEEEEKMG